MPKQAPSHATVVCIRGSLFGAQCLDLFLRKTLLSKNFSLYVASFRYFAGVVPLICLKVLMK